MSDSPPENIEVQQTQIIAVALIAMVVVFAAFGTFLLVQGMVPKLKQTGISNIFAVLAISNLILPFILTPLSSRIANGASREKAVSAWRGKIIVSYAAWEMACFMATVGMLLEQQIWMLGITAFVLFLMLVYFPTQNSLNAFLEKHNVSH